ncbi:MAG: MFS transporter [Actinomycetota bacterium]|nr:MFS transporter [Actinomycetota bacterium]
MSSSKRWTITAAVLGSGIVFLDSTVVNVALPKIGEDLQSSFLGKFAAENFVYYGYLLSLSALLILAGVLADYYGRRKMFSYGLIGFGVTSVLCAIAPSILLLIIGRILQGAAGALLIPGSLAIITAAFDGEEQGRAFGMWAGASAFMTILGPFVGGLLVDSVSWRAVFFINVPLVVFAVYATQAHVEESRGDDATPHFDWLGALTVFLAVGGLSFGAIIGQQQQWRGAIPFTSLLVGALAAVALPIEMRRFKDPLIPPNLFRSRNFTVVNVATVIIYGALYVAFAFLVIFLQGTLGYSPAAAGLVGIPMSLLLATLSSRFGKLASRYGARIFMSVGPAIMALGVLWFARLPAASPGWIFGTTAPARLLPPARYFIDLLPGYIVFGLGLSMLVAPLTTALMSSVSKQHSGVASAINNAISRVGPQLAGALIFVVIASTFYAGLESRVHGIDTSSTRFRANVAPFNRPDPSTPDEIVRASRGASTHSFHVAMMLAAGLFAAGGVVGAAGFHDPKGPPWMRTTKEALRPVYPVFRSRATERPPMHAHHTHDAPPAWHRHENRP